MAEAGYVNFGNTLSFKAKLSVIERTKRLIRFALPHYADVERRQQVEIGDDILTVVDVADEGDRRIVTAQWPR